MGSQSKALSSIYNYLNTTNSLCTYLMLFCSFLVVNLFENISLQRKIFRYRVTLECLEYKRYTLCFDNNYTKANTVISIGSPCSSYIFYIILNIISINLFRSLPKTSLLHDKYSILNSISNFFLSCYYLLRLD